MPLFRLAVSRWRLSAGAVLILLMALSAEGDVADGGSGGGAAFVNAAAGNEWAAGFLYGDWLKERRAYSDSDNALSQPASGNSASAGSFWRDVAGKVSDNALERIRGSVLGVVPAESEFRDLLVRYGNGEDVSMGEWREIRFARLREDFRGAPVALFADGEQSLADALAAAAQKRLAFIRRAELDIQTSLGGRKGQVGVDVAGALRESDDDVIGWQLRAFGGEDKAKGANAGLFWRVAVAGVGGEDELAGVNLFLDYEEDDTAGGFWRWSLGGEYKTRYGDISANRYVALTDAKTLADGTRVYSRSGIDADIAWFVPNYDFIRARLGYYKWDGEFGDGDDESFRFALDFLPGGGLRFGLEYDQNSGDIGGNLSYSREFGISAPSAGRAPTFDPRAHFFDAVRREYSQRISRTEDSGNPLVANLVSLSVQVSATVMAADIAATVWRDGDDLFDGAQRYVRYPIMLTQDISVYIGGDESITTAILHQDRDDWRATLQGDTHIAFLQQGTLLAAYRGAGHIDRLRGGLPGALVVPGTITLYLGGTRLAFDLRDSAMAHITLFEGILTVGGTQSAGGYSVAVLSTAKVYMTMAGSGSLAIVSCDGVHSLPGAQAFCAYGARFDGLGFDNGVWRIGIAAHFGTWHGQHFHQCAICYFAGFGCRR